MAVIVVAIADDARRARIVRSVVSEGYSAAEAVDASETLRITFELRPQALMLDMGVAEESGTDLLRTLRAATDIPIFALTPEREAEVVVGALDAGADDVADYDVEPGELLARLRAALRRATRPPAEGERRVVRTGDLVIDRAAQTVAKRGQPVALTRTEFKLLDALASRAGQVAPHRFLLTTVWGEAFGDDTHYLRVYIGYLRAKLEDDPSSPAYLVNEWGMGYRLVDHAVPDDAAEPAPSEEPEVSPEAQDSDTGDPGRSQRDTARRSP